MIAVETETAMPKVILEAVDMSACWSEAGVFRKCLHWEFGCRVVWIQRRFGLRHDL